MGKTKLKLHDLYLESLYAQLQKKTATDRKVMKLLSQMGQIDATYGQALLIDPKDYFKMVRRPEAFADRKRMYDLLEEARNLHAAKSWRGNFLINLAISYHMEKVASTLISGNAYLFKK